MEEEHADDCMTAPVHLAKVHQGIDCSRKGTIQPSSSLRDELCSTIRNVGLGLRAFDVRQVPLESCFDDQLEAEDSIFGKEHVLLENVHTIDSLLPEAFGHGVVTVEVLV